MVKSKDIIIGLLGIAVFILLGFILLNSEENTNETSQNEGIEKSILKENPEKNLNVAVLTTQDCIELGWKSDEKYRNCIELGRTNLYKSNDEEIDCVADFEKNPLFCKLLIDSCRLNFPKRVAVFADCLSYLE